MHRGPQSPVAFPIERFVGQLVGELFDFGFVLHFEFGHAKLPEVAGKNMPARPWERRLARSNRPWVCSQNKRVEDSE
jgi:hypothetical protein